MKGLLAGSSGVVGTALTDALVRDGQSVVRLVRSGSSANKEDPAKKNKEQRARTGPANVSDGAGNPTTCDLEGEPFGDGQGTVEGADAVVNLAGASIAGESWSEERKALIRSSRVHITRELGCALEKLEDGPKTRVSASAI